MNHPVDLHVIHYKEPQWMLDRCIASLDGQPVNIHIINGVKEMPPLRGRAKGFAVGTAKYCSYVDPDDLVKPKAFESLLAYEGTDLIWGNEEVIAEDGGQVIAIKTYPHHAFLIKRGLDIDYSRAARAVVAHNRLSKVHVDKTLYTWNFYLGTHARLRRS